MTSLPWLDSSELYFPCTSTALTEPNGLLAAGGDLSPQRLVHAYQQGIFPWYEDGEPLLWWSPSPRAVLLPSNIHVSKSLKKLIKKGVMTVSCDQQFEKVIHHCASTSRSGQTGTWITNEMTEAYIELHHLGIAHSVETWINDELVGGLYGINIGHIFFGESMYSHHPNASKLAFVALASNAKRWGFPLIDCQVSNPHLSSLGAETIDRTTFNRYLEVYTKKTAPINWADIWQGIDSD